MEVKMETEKDSIALKELDTIISQLTNIRKAAQENVGKCRPIINAQDIELAKDHLDLVVKYTRL
jgi:hypothetical protein